MAAAIGDRRDALARRERARSRFLTRAAAPPAGTSPCAGSGRREVAMLNAEGQSRYAASTRNNNISCAGRLCHRPQLEETHEPHTPAPRCRRNRPPVAVAGARALAQSPTTLKISHQFPGGTIDSGDFRDRLVRKFAADVEKRTNGALKFDIYPNASLVKVNSQFSAVRRGALDMSLVPISYSGGEVPETNIGLLPALVPSYEVGSKWKNAEVGKFLSQVLAEKGVRRRHVDLAGGRSWRAATKPLSRPTTPKGMKVRGGSREMDMMFKEAGRRCFRCRRTRSTRRCRPARWMRR
jgi:hypothetical protein